jgi:nuclear protein localization family protein 4
MMSLVIRVRTQLGTWRIQKVSPSDTLSLLRERLETENKTDLEGRPFTLDQVGLKPLPDSTSVAQAGLSNGEMIFAMIDIASTVFRNTHHPIMKTIAKDGTIVATEGPDDSKGFRRGMPSLRDMKMQWTLNQFISLDEQFVYKFKNPDKAFCTMANLNSSAVADFQNYMVHFDYKKMRVGYLYGTFKEDNSVTVECIYEPPQDNTDINFNLLDDPKAERVHILAGLLGLQKVGWIFAHPPREEKFFLSGAEVIAAAEQQLESAGGVEDTPFITITVTIDPADSTKRTVCAYQVTKQGMEMAAEGALLVSSNLGSCAIDPTFTAEVEMRTVKEVDTNFFLAVVPVKSFESEFLLTTFPKANRDGEPQIRNDLSNQISKAGKEGWTLQDLLSDFHLLLFLCDYLDISGDHLLLFSFFVHFFIFKQFIWNRLKSILEVVFK